MRTKRSAKLVMVLTVAALVGGTALALASTSKPNAAKRPAELSDAIATLKLTPESGPAVTIDIFGFQFAKTAPKASIHPSLLGGSQTLTVQKTLDPSSSTLFAAVSTNREFKQAVLVTNNGAELETLTCKDAEVSKWNQNFNQSEDLETFSLKCLHFQLATALDEA
jgi:hypothetical protein